MELRALRLFVTLAEELNFRRAAERANIAQPALTRHIQGLEQSLGVRLLERDKRSVSLTEAGRRLLAGLKPALLQLDGALASVRHQRSGVFRVGYISPALYSPLPRIVERFKGRFPAVRLTMSEMSNLEQVAALREGRLEVGFVGKHGLPKELAFRRVSRYHFLLALAEGHPLALHAAVGLGQLGGQTLITPSHREPLHREFLERITQAGATVEVQEAFGMDTVLNFVAAGMGVALVPELVQGLRRSGLTYRPVEPELPALELGLAWRKTDPSDWVAAFVAGAK